LTSVNAARPRECLFPAVKRCIHGARIVHSLRPA
jgi:hypothetical protein